MLASVAEQASLSQTWSETSEGTFSHDEAHLFIYMRVHELGHVMRKRVLCHMRSLISTFVVR